MTKEEKKIKSLKSLFVSHERIKGRIEGMMFLLNNIEDDFTESYFSGGNPKAFCFWMTDKEFWESVIKSIKLYAKDSLKQYRLNEEQKERLII